MNFIIFCAKYISIFKIFNKINFDQQINSFSEKTPITINSIFF